jgi:DNA polymerase-3 subunit delta
MIRVVSGENGFAITREINGVVGKFIDAHGDMAVEKIDAEEAEYDRIRESLESLPFLASRKLVLLRNPSANKQFVENAEKLLTNLSDTTDVLIFETRLDRRTAYYKFLKSHTDFSEFNQMDEGTLAKWLVEEAGKRKANMSIADARYLIERVGIDQSLLYNEIEKLVNFSTEVSRTNIDMLTEPSPKSTIFELLDAAFAGRRKKTIELYREQRQLKTEPQQIIAMLAWQLHIMALVAAAGGKSDGQIAKEAKINPYVVAKTRNITSKMGLSSIKKYINQLVKLDEQSKTSSINTDDALQAYLLSIS